MHWETAFKTWARLPARIYSARSLFPYKSNINIIYANMKLFKKTGKSLYAFVLISRGAFHSTQSSGNFGWYIKWNGPFRFGLTGIFGTSFEGSPLWPDQPKCPFPFDKIVPPIPLICILLTRTITMGWVYATRMYRSIGHVKFQASFFVEWKVL